MTLLFMVPYYILILRNAHFIIDINWRGIALYMFSGVNSFNGLCIDEGYSQYDLNKIIQG